MNWRAVIVLVALVAFISSFAVGYRLGFTRGRTDGIDSTIDAIEHEITENTYSRMELPENSRPCFVFLASHNGHSAGISYPIGPDQKCWKDEK